MKKGLIITLVVIVLIGIFGYRYFTGMYNNMVNKDQDVTSKWSQVENVYQRRMDLIPNLVKVVKGYASHEKETFEAVTEARSKAGGVMELNSNDLNDPETIARFEKAQQTISGSLQRLMMITENYPDLKANESFLQLQNELAGTENRISVERKRFIDSAQEFNTYIKRFPQVIFANNFGFTAKAYFSANEGAATAPKIDMSN